MHPFSSDIMDATWALLVMLTRLRCVHVGNVAKLTQYLCIFPLENRINWSFPSQNKPASNHYSILSVRCTLLLMGHEWSAAIVIV